MTIINGTPVSFRSTREIGQKFLDFYSALGHRVISGSSLLDDTVPMSFVMSAGMVQFEKRHEIGNDEKQFCLIQNCFRYFDLNQVGSSQMHLSLFQMPGAFTFGQPDRQQVVNQIWELLTKELGIPKESLYVTYFAGDWINGEKIPPDIDTRNAWLTVGLSPKQVLGLPAKHNFWVQTKQTVGTNNSQKQGPNTEVFFDRGNQYVCSPYCSPGCSCGRFLEFMNTLFITYRLDEQSHKLFPLDEPFTETVIGLERTAMILQSKAAIYEIDELNSLVKQVHNFSKPLQVAINDLDFLKLEWVVADHIRALLFLVADGAPPPGKGGRARLMRILIRELLSCQRLLGISDPGFLRSIIRAAAEYWHDLLVGESKLLEYLSVESEKFEYTIQKGLRDLDGMLSPHAKEEHLFIMMKTYGVPLSLLKYRLWQKRSTH